MVIILLLLFFPSESMFACVATVCECVSRCGDSAGLVTKCVCFSFTVSFELTNRLNRLLLLLLLLLLILYFIQIFVLLF